MISKTWWGFFYYYSEDDLHILWLNFVCLNVYSHPASRASICLPEWARRRKGGSSRIASNLWSHRSSNFWTESIFCQTGLFECEYPLFDKPMVTTVPTAASARCYLIHTVLLKHLFSHPANRASSFCLLEWGGEKEYCSSDEIGDDTSSRTDVYFFSQPYFHKNCENLVMSLNH